LQMESNVIVLYLVNSYARKRTSKYEYRNSEEEYKWHKLGTKH